MKTLPEVRTQMYIDGKWVEGSEEKLSAINPATGGEITQVTQGGTKETEEAIQAAKKAFPKWAGSDVDERAKMVHHIADLVEEDIERLALIVTLEQGKPLKEAQGEIQGSVAEMRWNAEEGKRAYGKIIPSENNHKFEEKKQPVGVAAAIIPWNGPFTMTTRKVTSALSAGSTIILKPSEETPLTSIAFFEVLEKAGLPDGVANLVMGDPSEIGKVFTDSDDVRKLTFTGSTAVGQQLYKQSSETMKNLSLELGGHAPFIVFDDAPLDDTVETLVKMKFMLNGQACISPNRIFVHESIKEEFTDKLVEAVKEIKVGNGQEDGVDAGPLINEEAQESIDDQIKDATNKGAEVLLGGGRFEKGEYKDGFFYEPTVIDGLTNDMTMFYEETFGPVIPLLTFSDDDKVIEQANDTQYGLAGYAFTMNLARAEKVSNALEYGTVGINNTGVTGQPSTPFGGMKYSGIGRENGTYGVEEFLETKFVNTSYLVE